jgi:hypothetical protein
LVAKGARQQFDLAVHAKRIEKLAMDITGPKCLRTWDLPSVDKHVEFHSDGVLAPAEALKDLVFVVLAHGSFWPRLLK